MATKLSLKKFSIGCGGLFIFLAVVIIAINPSEDNSPSIPYIDVTRSNAVNDTQILIDSKYVTETDMLTLGRQLAREYENEDYVFISIFSDREAAALYNKVIADTLTPEENKFYVDHYVGQYNKNMSQNFEIFVSQLNGLDVDGDYSIEGDDITYESADLR